MGNTDLTKPTSHIYWLWAAILAVASAAMLGYLQLRDRDELLAERMNSNELRLQVQLGEIHTQLAAINVHLFELKKNMEGKR